MRKFLHAFAAIVVASLTSFSVAAADSSVASMRAHIRSMIIGCAKSYQTHPPELESLHYFSYNEATINSFRESVKLSAIRFDLLKISDTSFRELSDSDKLNGFQAVAKIDFTYPMVVSEGNYFQMPGSVDFEARNGDVTLWLKSPFMATCRFPKYNWGGKL